MKAQYLGSDIVSIIRYLWAGYFKRKPTADSTMVALASE